MSESQPLNLRYIARATIQFETAFIVGGGRDLFFDDTFVADANGLPAIPGSSLAGILRHAWQEAKLGNVNELFGDQEQGSPLEISWGCIQNQNNVPVEGIIYDSMEISADDVLTEALTMAGRDHVRINDKGVADSGGKFDERSVSAGHRFSFELQLTAGPKGETLWRQLLKLLTSGVLRLGGKTRRGYGTFKVAFLKEKRFDLSNDSDFSAYCNHPISLAAEAPTLIDAPEMKNHSASLPTGTAQAIVKLTPEGFWMFGGGWGDEADMNPVKANRIIWTDGKGSVEKNVALVPGSSVKGALAHRTAFYYNLEQKLFAKAEKDYAPGEVKPVGTENEAVRALFGYSKDQKDGQRGRVIISDLFVEGVLADKFINHVSIDRFTGGARSGALFSEKPYFRNTELTLEILMTDIVEVEPYRKAFEQALDDLVNGLLPLGGGVNRGNGFFTGEVQWRDKPKQQTEVTHG